MRRFVVGLAMLTIALAAPFVARADDQQIAQDIVDKLKEHKASGALSGFNIDLEVDSGTVWLKGNVSSERQHELALEVTRETDGVEQVVDDLEVAEPQTAGEPKNVKKLLANLQGKVAPASHASEPQETAAKEDEKIAQTILKLLQAQKESGKLRGFDLNLSVEAGTVWIKGNVASKQQQTLVLEIARRVSGVVQVVNDISVGTAETLRPVSAQAEIAPATGSHAGNQTPLAYAPARTVQYEGAVAAEGMTPVPMHQPSSVGIAAARYDHPNMPGYAWPSYASYPNYAAVTYPRQYSPTAWPYIGPFYPYPQAPLGWRKVMLKWKDGWWQLDFRTK